MRRTSDSGDSVPCAVTITSARPKTDHSKPAATSATIASTSACAMRTGSAVRIAMPSTLWSSSASCHGLGGGSRFTVFASDQCELGFQQARFEHHAQFFERAALQRAFRVDVFNELIPLRRMLGLELRIDAHSLMRGSLRVGQQTRLAAKAVGNPRFEPLRTADRAVRAVLAP